MSMNDWMWIVVAVISVTAIIKNGILIKQRSTRTTVVQGSNQVITPVGMVIAVPMKPALWFTMQMTDMEDGTRNTASIIRK